MLVSQIHFDSKLYREKVLFIASLTPGHKAHFDPEGKGNLVSEVQPSLIQFLIRLHHVENYKTSWGILQEIFMIKC